MNIQFSLLSRSPPHFIAWIRLALSNFSSVREISVSSFLVLFAFSISFFSHVFFCVYPTNSDMLTYFTCYGYHIYRWKKRARQHSPLFTQKIYIKIISIHTDYLHTFATHHIYRKNILLNRFEFLWRLSNKKKWWFSFFSFSLLYCSTSSPWKLVENRPFLPVLLHLTRIVEFMGNDIKSPQHTSVHPMYVSYSTIPPNNNGSPSSTTKINPQKDFPNNQFGVVLTSINLHSNTNSLSSTYLRTHKFYPPQTSSSNINSPARSHQFNQSPTTHYRLIDQRQLSSSSSLNQYNSRQNLINKSASTQQIIKRNPSFTSSPVGAVAGNLNNVTGHRSDIRYTEIISATDEILMNDDRDVDANSIRSYGRPSSQASTAAASPIITNKLLATNLQQQQLISKSFGIHSNPLSNLVHNNGGDEGERLILRGSRQQLIDYEQKPMKVSKDLPALPPPVPQHRMEYSQGRCLSPSQLSLNNKSFIHNSPHHSSPVQQDKFPPPHPQHHQQFIVARSPNLNHMSKRRQSQLPASPLNSLPPHQPLESASGINTASRTPKVGLVHREPFESIRDRPLPPIPRYNLNQFIPEYHCPNPLPAIPPHMLQHPMYRVRSQDRISNRLKRQTGVNGNNERPRSFCNNMINYQDYKDMQ